VKISRKLDFANFGGWRPVTQLIGRYEKNDVL